MLSRRFFLSFIIILLASIFSANVIAIDTRDTVNKHMSKPQIRGSIVFKHYCILCHGERGDGRARATKLHSEINLRIERNTYAYYEKIIREGGKANNKSAFMPPWDDELSDEQINDVILYLGNISNPVRRGEAVFKSNCILCHGVNGDGKGRASPLYDPPPANLTQSDKNNAYKRMIITHGGAAMGRSPVMPAWNTQLSKQEINDVVSYLKTILITN